MIETSWSRAVMLPDPAGCRFFAKGKRFLFFKGKRKRRQHEAPEHYKTLKERSSDRKLGFSFFSQLASRCHFLMDLPLLKLAIFLPFRAQSGHTIRLVLLSSSIFFLDAFLFCLASSIYFPISKGLPKALHPT